MLKSLSFFEILSLWKISAHPWSFKLPFLYQWLSDQDFCWPSPSLWPHPPPPAHLPMTLHSISAWASHRHFSVPETELIFIFPTLQSKKPIENKQNSCHSSSVTLLHKRLLAFSCSSQKPGSPSGLLPPTPPPPAPIPTSSQSPIDKSSPTSPRSHSWKPSSLPGSLQRVPWIHSWPPYNLFAVLQLGKKNV